MKKPSETTVNDCVINLISSNEKCVILIDSSVINKWNTGQSDNHMTIIIPVIIVKMLSERVMDYFFFFFCKSYKYQECHLYYYLFYDGQLKFD